MAAEEVLWLNLDDLNAVLARAKAEQWTALALMGGDYKTLVYADFVRSRLSAAPVFFVSHQLREVPLPLTQISSLKSLHLLGHRIDSAGAAKLTRLIGLSSLDLRGNQIDDDGAIELVKLSSLTSLCLADNNIGVAGARAILDAWAEPTTANRRQFLDLRDNGNFSGLLPAEVLKQTDAQAIIAAWRQHQKREAARLPLPMPEAAGEPVAHGLPVVTARDGQLTLLDPASGSGARDDAIGRELHTEVIRALDRLIAAVGQKNALSEWRESAEGAKERLGGGPREVRVSAILRIERLRSLREADERRRVEPDPLIEPAEAGVAAALRDAVAAANLYIETDPYLAEQQRRLADPGLDMAISTEEAAAAEAEMAELDIADPALLAELRLGRETAEAGGSAGGRALAWLAGSWRNVVREMLRQVLAWVREQVKAARASAGGTAMQAKLGAAITIDEALEVLAAMGLQGRRAVGEAIRASGESAGRILRHGEPILGKAGAGVFILWLADQVGLLTRLGWSREFAVQIQRLLAGIAG
jgi:hypothetical protein